jgi:predicted RNase H-like HicB family nuclease
MFEKNVKAIIYHDGEQYCGKCLEIDVFTQGKTVDEVIKNLEEAVSLHLVGVDPATYGLAKEPSLLIMIEAELQHAYA